MFLFEKKIPSKTTNCPLALCVLFFILAFAGCSSVDLMPSFMSTKPQPVTPSWKNLVITASTDVNVNSPVAIDILFVKNMDLLRNLANLNSTSWFASRENSIKSFPEALQVISYELVPGQNITVTAKQLSQFSAFQALTFVNYSTPGDHKGILSMDQPGYLIKLESRDVIINPVSVLN
jgi:type VI secretion system protein